MNEAVQLADKVIVLSHRPSSVIDEIDIEHPRHARTEEILQVAIQAIESAQQQNVA